MSEIEDSVLVTAEETELISTDVELNFFGSEDPLFQLEEDDFDGDIETKFVEPLPQTISIDSPAVSGWYIQKLYPSVFSKNKTKAKSCGKGTFQGSYGFPISKCLGYYGRNSDDFLKAQKYECNSTHMKKSVFTDSSCSHLLYSNISKIHCTQKCSTFGGYPYYNGSQYRLQVGQASDSGCKGDKTYYYIEMGNVCQYQSYNQSMRIIFPYEYDYNNYNCNGFGPARMGSTVTTVPSGNLSYGCLARPYDKGIANALPTTKYVSIKYPGYVITNDTTPDKTTTVHSSYPGGLTYSQIIGWSLAITICFTCCCCLLIAYCCMTYCPWCLTCCLGPTEVKEKRVMFHGTVHYRQSSEKHVEKPFDPTVTEPSKRVYEQRYVNGAAEDGEYVEGSEEGAVADDDESVAPVGRDTTGMNLINQFAYEDEPQPYYDSQRGYESRRSNYNMRDDNYNFDYAAPQQEMVRYPSYSQQPAQYQQQQYYASEYNEDYSRYGHHSATFDAYV